MLASPAAPIVLLPRRAGGLTDGVAPGLADVGLMLPYTPVHHLLFARLGPVPLVMTSANQGGSPIVFRDSDIDWLDGLIDGVLTHDRPIHVAVRGLGGGRDGRRHGVCRCVAPAGTRRCR